MFFFFEIDRITEDIFIQGIDYLHTLPPYPIIHRDLKSKNVTLLFDGTILFNYFFFWLDFIESKTGWKNS